MARTLTSPRLLPLAALAAALLTSSTAVASSPACTIRGTDRGDALTGTAGRDVICGRGGNDRLRGLGGDDVLLGGDGHDLLEGGAGNDRLESEKGSDVADGGAGNDSVVGGDGHDLLGGGSGNDTLEGSAGTDTFLGGADADVVNSADGTRDLLISCGSGKDTARIDARDPRAHDCETRTDKAQADLSISLADAPDPVDEGQPVEYRFSVRNAGPDTATGVTVATTLPADATAEAASGCSAAGSVVTCSLADVPAGGSAGGALTVRHGSAGSKTVTSTVDAQTEDANAANDSASETTTVEPEPAPDGAGVSVSVSDDADPAAVLQDVRYTVVMRNAGPLAADAVSLVMDIDESWAAIARPSGCTQTTFPTTKVTCSVGSLAAGERVSRVLGVSWSGSGDQTVKATVSSTTADPDAADNSETETTTVN